MGDIVQILSATDWWALYAHGGQAERHPLIAWALLDSGQVIGLVEGEDHTPVLAPAYDNQGFDGYYRNRQRACMHQMRDNAKTYAEDPNWRADCRGELPH